MLELKVRGFPESWLSWGEKVIVLFEQNCVYVTSICDPESKPSMTAYGRNGSTVREILNSLPALSAPPGTP